METFTIDVTMAANNDNNKMKMKRKEKWIKVKKKKKKKNYKKKEKKKKRKRKEEETLKKRSRTRNRKRDGRKRRKRGRRRRRRRRRSWTLHVTRTIFPQEAANMSNNTPHHKINPSRLVLNSSLEVYPNTRIWCLLHNSSSPPLFHLLVPLYSSS